VIGRRLGPRAGRLYFEYLHFRYDDPYDLRRKAYVEETYARELAALGERSFERGLEIGCSIGTLTERLAPRCDSLLALDVSHAAVRTARQRLSHLPWVRVERRKLPRRMPRGPFDLIVASEVLFFWKGDALIKALPKLEDALSPGGTLLALHWRGENPQRPLQADDVHELLAGHTRLEPVVTATESEYRLDRFDKPVKTG
jgi:trans-aconitate methyltransferase